MSTYINRNGVRRIRPRQIASADGAITITDGIVYITKGTAAALTLAAPPTDLSGTELVIISTTAAAHTVTNTSPGFNGGSTASDVGTFGGAIGDGIVLTPYNGVWHVVTKTNVTLA